MSDHDKTHAEKVLDAIDAVIEKRATSDHQSYVVNGVAVTKMKIEELLKFREIYIRKVELDWEKFGWKAKKVRKIKVRFV